MLTKRQKQVADSATRATVAGLLRRQGVKVSKHGLSTERLAKLAHQHLGVQCLDDPMLTLQVAANECAVEAVPSRDIRAIDQPAYTLRGWLLMAAERARAAQPPMMSMCGIREGWGG